MRLMSEPNEQNINRIIHLMQTDESFDAPQDAIRWSKNIFRTRAVEPKKSVVEKILAILQMDLSPNRAAFGERSTSGSAARQMLFQAGDASIDLRIKRDEKNLTVKGQILGEGFANCAAVISNDEVSFETRANELSEFSFDDIPSGVYNMSLKSVEREIALENLELR